MNSFKGEKKPTRHGLVLVKISLGSVPARIENMVDEEVRIDRAGLDNVRLTVALCWSIMVHDGRTRFDSLVLWVPTIHLAVLGIGIFGINARSHHFHWKLIQFERERNRFSLVPK